MNTGMRHTFGRSKENKLSLIISQIGAYPIVGKTKEENILTVFDYNNSNATVINPDTYQAIENWPANSGVNFRGHDMILSSNGTCYITPNQWNSSGFRRLINKAQTNPINVSRGFDFSLNSAAYPCKGAIEDINNVMWFFPNNLAENILKVNSSDESITRHFLSSINSNYSMNEGGAEIFNNHVYILMSNTSVQGGILKININDNTETFFPLTFQYDFTSLELGNDGNLYSVPFQSNGGKILKFDTISETFSYIQFPQDYNFTDYKCRGFSKLWNEIFIAYPVSNIDGFVYTFNPINQTFLKHSIPQTVSASGVRGFNYTTLQNPNSTFISSIETNDKLVIIKESI